MVTIDDFLKVELKVGTVLEAEDIEGSEKLIKLKVDIGEDPSASSGRDIRQILAGIKQFYAPEDLVGKQIVVIANLEPRIMMGSESNGMLLAADTEDGPIFLTTVKKVPNGSKIR